MQWRKLSVGEVEEERIQREAHGGEHAEDYPYRQECDDVHADEVMEAVGFVPVYRPLLSLGRELHAHERRPFYEFAYDWRRDNLESADALVRFLAEVSARHGSLPVQVVAHSMGGTLTLAAMHRRPELVACALLAGVPTGPSVAFLEDLHVGAQAGLSHEVYAPALTFTYPSSYFTFPLTAELDGPPWHTGLFRLGSGDDPTRLSEQSSALWHDAAWWRAHHLSVFADHSLSTAQLDQAERHLAHCLRRAAQYRHAFVPRAGFAYPPLATLASYAQPTKHVALLDGPRAVRGLDFESAERVPGDGRVVYELSGLPYSVPHHHYRTRLPHTDLLNDTELVVRILNHLLHERDLRSRV
jgi:pimeloyl-ACP methyl ester carboxylesterase